MKQIDFEINLDQILDNTHFREKNEFYLGMNKEDESDSLHELNIDNTDQLFSHIPKNLKKSSTTLPAPLSYDETKKEMENISKKNIIKPSFIGDSLQNYKTQEIVPYVCSLRNLVTAYTPYQPERSQGTLNTLWMYSNLISKLTGFEAINASLYDRSTALFEACKTAMRIKKKYTVLVAGILPQDQLVLETMSKNTNLTFLYTHCCEETGLVDQNRIKKICSENNEIAAIAFSQTNSLGFLEDVNFYTDFCEENKLLSIAIIDIMLLGNNGLIPPNEYGQSGNGCSMFVGEGQHLAIGPNFGGPGLGIFGIRYNAQNKTNIRQTAGRFIGKTVDNKGVEALCMVLSTREQHIRREKATSNICSNQSFIATLAGAALLNRGNEGLEKSHTKALKNATNALNLLTSYNEFNYPPSLPAYYNEFTLKYSGDLELLLKNFADGGLNLGINVSNRLNDNFEYLKLSFSDIHEEKDFILLENLLNKFCTKNSDDINKEKLQIDNNYLRTSKVLIPDFSLDEIKEYYNKLNSLNMGTDENLYPLGSCTMKYNPFLNEYAASLPGFTDIHPQSPTSDIQGSLEVLFEIQEAFKSITNLPFVTTQPLAGAQGELVGLKMFQAYHNNKNNLEKNIILIPSSAHGTNPASATVAGFNIHILKETTEGEISISELEHYLKENGSKVAGMMITNPNTSGIFEKQFKEIAEKIHNVDGLMYMDGANLNAISEIVDLQKMGVDAVHSNLHKTFTIPHGGGGPGDAIVAVSNKLEDFLPGIQVIKNLNISTDNEFEIKISSKTIGSTHRNFGNFAHKVRALTYLKVLGNIGVKKMSSHAVLASNYLLKHLKEDFPILPSNCNSNHRLHEFIITISEEQFKHLEQNGIPKSKIIGQIGKLFLDFGPHAPTVSFPEQYGLMIEPTESFSKKELDRFIEIIKTIKNIINEMPELLKTAPHLTPVGNVDQVKANKELILTDSKIILSLPDYKGIEASELNDLTISEIIKLINEKTNDVKSV